MPRAQVQSATVVGDGIIVQGDKNVVWVACRAGAERARRRGDRPEPVKAKDQAVAAGGDITDSTLITAQTVVIADRYWRSALQPRLPEADLRPAIQAYLD